jgi:hypothetical protein
MGLVLGAVFCTVESKSMSEVKSESKVKSKIKGVGQECPTHILDQAVRGRLLMPSVPKTRR